MTDTHTPQPRPGVVTWSRRVLVLLAALFTLGAFTQFFLVGLSFFDDAARWNDHATLGHILGVLPYVMWIPAVLGKTGRGMIIATIVLFVSFMLQYVFIEVDSSMVNAFHPLNGSFLLVLSWWITMRTKDSLRQPSETTPARSEATDETALPDKLERATS